MVTNIIMGLGNPGERYARTRHNAGFRVMDHLAEENRVGEWSLECDSLVAGCSIGGRQVILAKPMTYMNLSGRAAGALLEKCSLGLAGLVLILDDLNLPLGRLRIRERGSGGGHHGLESVIAELRSEEFVRVRIGVGEETLPPDKAAFVLSDFPRESDSLLEKVIFRAGDAIKTILSEGVSRAMSIFNGQA